MRQESDVFDPTTMRVLAAAFDQAVAIACFRLGLTEQDLPDHVREIIAYNIVELAVEGERDLGALKDRGLSLSGLGVS